MYATSISIGIEFFFAQYLHVGQEGSQRMNRRFRYLAVTFPAPCILSALIFTRRECTSTYSETQNTLSSAAPSTPAPAASLSHIGEFLKGN